MHNSEENNQNDNKVINPKHKDKQEIALNFKESEDWEREFLSAPLIHVDLTELRKQRSPEDVAKLAKLLIRYKHILSDGVLDFTAEGCIKHRTVCKIATSVPNPKIHSVPRHVSPEGRAMHRLRSY